MLGLELFLIRSSVRNRSDVEETLDCSRYPVAVKPNGKGIVSVGAGFTIRVLG